MPSSRALGGEILASSKEAKPQAAKGRECSFVGCTTKLSIYNLTDRCSQHPAHKVLSSGKKR